MMLMMLITNQTTMAKFCYMLIDEKRDTLLLYICHYDWFISLLSMS